MRKIFIIIRREYLVRVTHKLFLVSTLLAPLLLGALMVIPIIIAATTEKEETTVYVIDNGSGVMEHLKGDDRLHFLHANAPMDTLKSRAVDTKGMAVLVLPQDLSRKQLTATFFAGKAPSLQVERQVERAIVKAVQRVRLIKEGLTADKVQATEVDLALTSKTITKEGEKSGSALLAYAVGNGMGFLIYIMLAAYGQIVMQGVMEEKTNRIMEVMVSSVRPMELMFGKIVSIGLVGLTQFVLWSLFAILIMFGIGAWLGVSDLQMPDVDASQLEGQAAQAYQFKQIVKAFDVSLIFYFLIYFAGGFFMYGSLFAAVGSAADQPQDAQNLAFIPVLPLMVPILVLTPVISNPGGPLAFWMSMIPLFSPTIMLVRLAAGPVAWWEQVLSMVLLFGGVALVAWLSARIYRVGVLLYGKKVTPGELLKWVITKT